MFVIPVRLLLALGILAGLSVALVWTLPDEALARPVFQSPLTDQPPVVTPTVTITGTRQVTPTPPAEQSAVNPDPIALPSPRPADGGPMAKSPSGNSKAPGFLPAPTLSAPDSQLPSLLPGPSRPLVAPPAPTPRPTPATDNAANDPSALARLIDTIIIALSYIWLCCGIFVLIGVTLGLVWLARSKRRV